MNADNNSSAWNGIFHSPFLLPLFISLTHRNVSPSVTRNHLPAGSKLHDGPHQQHLLFNDATAPPSETPLLMDLVQPGLGIGPAARSRPVLKIAWRVTVETVDQ